MCLEGYDFVIHLIIRDSLLSLNLIFFLDFCKPFLSVNVVNQMN